MLSSALARLVLAASLLASPLCAQTPQAPAPLTEEQKAEGQKAAWIAAAKTAVKGPSDIPLADQARLALPREMIFVPAAEAAAILRAYGNRPGAETLTGMVVSEAEDWWAVIRFIKEGYVKDDDARDWNPDDLLAGLREGTEESNAERRQRGFPEIEVVGWLEKPAYDAAAHRLVWAMQSKLKSTPGSGPSSVNYNTYALGREGYFSINLLTDTARLATERHFATDLLGGLAYVEGKRYGDFSAGTDKVAAYGLAALVGGVALKKLGLLAAAGVFLAKFAKVGLVALAGIGFALRRWFTRTKPPA